LNIVSDIVNDAIPEIEYARLRDIPERELREEEAHLVHVWEMINPIKTDNKNLQKTFGYINKRGAAAFRIIRVYIVFVLF
jgi:hypothetical protein